MTETNLEKTENTQPLSIGETLITVKSLCKQFDETRVLTGIDIEIKKGDVVAVIGPSGCGKSTFLRCLNLLEQPTAGEICIGGEDLFRCYSLYTAEKIAEALNSSVSSLAHTFKKDMNISVHQYILKKRLIKARQKIMGGEPVIKAALDCGFNDYSGFYKQYKKMFNEPPSKNSNLF